MTRGMGKWKSEFDLKGSRLAIRAGPASRERERERERECEGWREEWRELERPKTKEEWRELEREGWTLKNEEKF